ncbi:hypothetical protein HII36_21835 [Nonomuraea sp. NN258]|uniref:hypothetical protein n=1 Tax=Nonomuraea antri TaxID=2730852 RepID=UPI00156A2A9A|nr:hypothetical protein [Nonomuraea antri]NRQ34474.1 hypothetical protein [Nonomuraea antri]
MTQLNDTTAAEYTPIEPTDFLHYLARSVARDLDHLADATHDGVPSFITAAVEIAAHGMDALIGALMQAEGLTVEEAQARADGLISEEEVRDDLINRLMYVDGLTEAEALVRAAQEGADR